MRCQGRNGSLLSPGRALRRGGQVSGLAALLLGCALDLEGVGQALVRAVPTPIPELSEEVPASLPSPEGLRATSGELRSVPLKWDPLLVGAVGGYTVECSASRTGPFKRVAVLQDRVVTEWIDRSASGSLDAAQSNASLQTDPSDGLTRYYRVRAFSPEGRLSEPSGIVAATTAPTPAPPEGLRAFSHQPRQVPLSWEAAKDPTVTGYVVYRSPASAGPFDEIHRIAERYETIHVDRDLGDLRVFYYSVSALNGAGGEGRLSAPVRAVTKPEPLPPYEVHISEQQLGENVLEWAPNVESDIVEYQLIRFRAGSEIAELVAVLPSTENRAVDSGVLADEVVQYSLIAVDRDELESAPSARLSVESQGYDLIATARQDGIHLAWNARVGEGYRRARVLRRGVFGYAEIGVSDDGAFLDRDVDAGQRYEYSVTLERPDASQGPPSLPVAINLPGG